MPASPDIRYYYINCAHADQRRDSAEQQAQAFGLPLERIEAIRGRDFQPQDYAKLGYRAERRQREMPVGLTPNEHGCLQSHLKTLKTFLDSDSGAGYAVVLEDDFVLEDHFKEGIGWLTQKTSGWEICKLFSKGKQTPYPLTPPSGIKFRLVHPDKITCASTAFLYTRKGARLVLESFKNYEFPFDTQLGRNLLTRPIPYCSISPALVGLMDNAEETSCINESDSRLSLKGTKRSFSQYLTHRWRIFTLACAKLSMRWRMGKRLRIHP